MTHEWMVRHRTEDGVVDMLVYPLEDESAARDVLDSFRSVPAYDGVWLEHREVGPWTVVDA